MARPARFVWRRATHAGDPLSRAPQRVAMSSGGAADRHRR